MDNSRIHVTQNSILSLKAWHNLWCHVPPSGHTKVGVGPPRPQAFHLSGFAWLRLYISCVWAAGFSFPGWSHVLGDLQFGDIRSGSTLMVPLGKALVRSFCSGPAHYMSLPRPRGWCSLENPDRSSFHSPVYIVCSCRIGALWIDTIKVYHLALEYWHSCTWDCLVHGWDSWKIQDWDETNSV